MARRHTSKGPSRPIGPSDPDDALFANTFALSTWVQRQRQALILVGITVAAVVAGTLYYMSYRGDHLQRAALELERVQQGAAFGDTTTARTELAQYVRSFGNTPYGDEARLLLGELYLESGQADEAANVLAEAAEHLRTAGAPGGHVARESAGAAGAVGGGRAASATGRGPRGRLDFQVRDALEGAARLRTLQEDISGALDLYRRILDGIEEDAPERGVYEMRIGELRLQDRAGVVGVVTGIPPLSHKSLHCA